LKVLTLAQAPGTKAFLARASVEEFKKEKLNKTTGPFSQDALEALEALEGNIKGEALWDQEVLEETADARITTALTWGEM
jgi:hypothetical protein